MHPDTIMADCSGAVRDSGVTPPKESKHGKFFITHMIGEPT